MENFKSEVKAELVTKFAEQEKIVADVAKHFGLLGMVKAMITTRLNEGLSCCGSISNFPF